MEKDAQAIDITLRRGLRLSILFRCGIAWRAERDGIFRLSRLEMARYAEIDQVEMLRGRAQNIRRLQVAKNDRGIARVQVMEDGAEL